MVDKAGAAAGNLGGLTGSASSDREWWIATLEAPAEIDVSPSPGPMLYVSATSWNTEEDPTVQVQMSTADTFASTVFNETLVQPWGGTVGRQVIGLTDGVTYYWRARAGDSSGNWGLWSETRSLLVELDTGRAFMQMTTNVGVTLIIDPDATLNATQNVGFEDRRKTYWPVYSMENIGIPDSRQPFWPAYVMENVDTNTPAPIIWFLRPAYGREGDGIDIVGFGFGDLQTTFDGVVEIDWGGSTGWQPVPVVSWQTFFPTADAYTGDREIDQVLGVLDPQHTVIQITVPTGAIPPGYPVRVRTDGP